MRGRRIKSDAELGLRMVEGLRVAARRPNIYGYVPHGKQDIFHKSAARKKLFIGGNRSGKTVGGGTEAVWWMTGKHPYRAVPKPPTYGRIVSVDFKEGVEKIVKPEIARWLPPSEILGGSWDSGYDKELRTLYLANGSFVEFMSYEQDIEKFAGTSRHWIWFDEEPPEDIYTECLMRLIDTGGSFWITMTPVEGMTWTYDTLYERSNPSVPDFDPNILVVEVDSTMNPHLNPGELDIILAGLDENDKKARLRGQYVQRGGLIYPMFNEIIHTLDPIEAKAFNPSKWMHFCMMDAGITNPTAWLWAAVDLEGRMVIYDEYYKSGETVEVHAKEVLARNHYHQIAPLYNVGDPSIRNKDPVTGTSVQIAYIENGVPIVLGNNDVTAGIDAVRRKFGGPKNPSSLYITKNCVNLIWELKRYRFALWANKKMDREKNLKEEPNKKNDHACDALRYGVASRPLVEDLSIPEDSLKNTGLSAVSPYHARVDPGTTRPDSRALVDDILGSEW